MPIVGFNFEKISGQKLNPLKKGMKATHNITINSVKEEKIPIAKSEKTGLKFDFEFSVKYEPKIGDINILGTILYLDEEKEIKSILSEWNKNKKIKPEVAAQIINTAIVKSAIKALALSQDINLPPHLPIPIISPPRQEDNYIG